MTNQPSNSRSTLPVLLPIVHRLPPTFATFASNTIRLTGASVSGLTGVQTLANITFTAVASKGDSSAVSVGGKTLATATGAPIKATVVDGRIRIK